MKPTYECKFDGLSRFMTKEMKPYWRAHIELLKDYGPNKMKGDKLVTSRVSSMDFDAGLVITKNSFYQFDPATIAKRD